MLEGKEVGFKVVKVTMSPRYIWTTRNRSAVARVFRWTPYGLERKVSCHPFTVLHFEFCKKKGRWTYDLKINALLIFRNLLAIGSCSWQGQSSWFSHAVARDFVLSWWCLCRVDFDLLVCRSVRAMDVVYTENAYNTSDIFRGRSIIETVNWLG